MKNLKKKLPTLSDSDIVTENLSSKKKNSKQSIKLSSVAIALSLTTAFISSPGCVDPYDCDSDTTQIADPYDNGSYDTGANQDPYDYGNYDTTTIADVECD
jgi:hypothetical protein